MDYKIFEIVVSAVLTNMFPVIGSVGAAIACSLLNTARRKVKVEKGVKTQQVLDKVIVDVVGSLNQTIVGDIKRARRKLKQSDIENIKNIAVDQINNIASKSVIKDTKSVVTDIDEYINTNIENQVRKQRTNFNESGEL